MRTDIVIAGGRRTAMAEYVGTPGHGRFAGVSANELGGHAIRGALEDARVAPADVDHVIMGNALQTSVDALYGARHAALRAGIPVTTPALTVNRLCGSGIQSLISAGHELRDGTARIVVAGGMENMSQAPFALYGQHVRAGVRFGETPPLVDTLFSGLRDSYAGVFMAETADNAAREQGVTREEADEFALRSHRLGAEAVARGVFREEIVPVTVRVGRSEVVVDRDDHVKPETTIEALRKLRAAFGEGGTVTAGNASGIVDGAAALVVTTAAEAARRGLAVLARVVGHAVAGVPPHLMAMGPVPAIRALWASTGIDDSGVDLYEINEAFAPQYVACEKALGLARDRVNVNGGAVALGHPLGATGTRLVLTLARELARRGGKTGIAAACIGGGQGIAVMIERPRA